MVDDLEKTQAKYEKPKRKSFTKRTGYFMFQIIFGVLLLGGAGWWGYTQVMKFVFGRYDILGMKESVSGIFGTAEVLLLDPVRTEEFLRHDEGDTTWPYRNRQDQWKLADTLWYAEGKKRPQKLEFEAWRLIGGPDASAVTMRSYWEQTLLKDKISYKIIQEPELTKIPPGYEILIVPGALLLSKEEKKGIKDFVSDGGNLLATWLVGVRDEKGDWVGYEFLAHLLGGSVSQSVDDVAGGSSVVLRGNSPITAMIPPGTHLDLYTYNGYLTFNLFEPRSTSDGFWFKPYWRSPAGQGSGSDCLIAHGTYVKGKYVWFGFTPETVQGVKDNQTILFNIVENCYDWLQGKPILNARVWPLGFQAGGSILIDAKGNYNSIEHIVQKLTDDKIGADYIIDQKYDPKGINLKDFKLGDVVVSLQNADQMDESTFDNYLMKITNETKKIVGKSAIGYFPFNWNYSLKLIDALAAYGVRYVFTDITPRYYGPEIKMAIRGGWWLISRRVPIGSCPKAQLSLQEWNMVKGIRGEDRLLKAMIGDLKRIRTAGGMYLGILDPEILEREKAEELPLKLATAMDSSNVWRASTAKIIERYGGWTGLRVACQQVTDTRLMLSLSNVGKIPLREVIYDLYLTDDFSDVAFRPQKIGVNATKLLWNQKDGICTFVLTEIGPRDNLSIIVDLTLAQDYYPESDTTGQVALMKK